MEVVEAAALVGSLGLDIDNQVELERSRQKALDMQSEQIKLAANQRSLMLTRKVNQVISRQKVMGAASGFGENSPSFAAITRDTVNQYQQDENANKLNESFKQFNIEQERENARREEIAGIAGSGLNTADFFFKGGFPGEFGL
jgi:hypothetical protein